MRAAILKRMSEDARPKAMAEFNESIKRTIEARVGETRLGNAKPASDRQRTPPSGNAENRRENARPQRENATSYSEDVNAWKRVASL